MTYRLNVPPGWPPPPPGWTPPPGWQPDPTWPPPPIGWQLWVPVETTAPLAADYRGPARSARSAAWWLWIGWWWEPLAWLGRMSLYAACAPVGIWRSVHRGRRLREARQRRGWQQP